MSPRIGHARGSIVLAVMLLLTIGTAKELFVYKDQFGVTGQAKTDGTGMKNPAGVAVAPDGTILVLDSENHRLIRLDADLNFVTQFGVTGEAKTDATGFNKPRSLTVDAAGNVFVLDTYNNRLVKLNTNLQYVGQFGVTGQSGADNTHLNAPVGVDVDSSGNVYVADQGMHRVVKFNNDLQYISQAGVTGEVRTDTSGFNKPAGIALDSEGNLYISDRLNSRLVKLDPDFNFVCQFGITGETRSDNKGLNTPLGVAVGPDGNVYVTDQFNQRIIILTPDLQYISQFGVTGVPKADETGLNSPYGLDLDANGRILIADWHNQRIARLARPGDAYWDAKLPLKRTLSVTEKTGSDLRDVQVKVTLDTASLVSAGKLRSDCGDLRFVDPEHGSLPYYIASGCNSASTIIWVRMPELKASTSRQLTLRYGNAAWEGRSSFEQTMTPPRVEASTVALWHFDEGAGDTATDVSGRGNHAVSFKQRLKSKTYGEPIDENAGRWYMDMAGRAGDASLTLTTTSIKEGSGAIKVVGGTSENSQIMFFNGGLDVSWWQTSDNRLGGTLEYWVWVDDAAISNPLKMELSIANNGPGLWNAPIIPTSGEWVTGWNHVSMDLPTTAYHADLVSVDWANTEWLEVYGTAAGASNNYFVFDDFKISSKPSWTDGKFGKAVSFDGKRDYLKVESSDLGLTNAFTIEAWIYNQPQDADFKRIITRGGDFVLGTYLQGTTRAGLLLTNPGTSTWYDHHYEVMPENEWSHIAGSFDGQYIRTYIDGELKSKVDAGEGSTLRHSTDTILIEIVQL